MPRIGIDLGGTKIEGIVLEDDGGISHRRRIGTPAGDYPGTVAAIVSLVASLEADRGRRCRVGIGTPGSLSPSSGLMRNANSTCLIGKPLDRDLSVQLARPVRIANDADCFALSEASDGAGQGANSVFGVIIGTGTGGGVVVGGRLLVGSNGIAGEWGHNPLPWRKDEERPGPPCYCGKHGCIETFLSGPGLARDYPDPPGADSGEQVAEAAEQGDPLAEACLRRYETRLARALASVINIIDPEIIVLGGGLSKMGRLYRNVPTLWGDHVFSDTVLTRLLPPIHGDSGGARGAAWLWPADAG